MLFRSFKIIGIVYQIQRIMKSHTYASLPCIGGNGRHFAVYSATSTLMMLTIETNLSVNSKSFPVCVFIKIDKASFLPSTSSTISAFPVPIMDEYAVPYWQATLPSNGMMSQSISKHTFGLTLRTSSLRPLVAPCM